MYTIIKALGNASAAKLLSLLLGGALWILF